MKIATYNVNSINARVENLTAWLAEAAPDVVLVQEIKSEYNNFPFFELRAAGYNAQILGQKLQRRCRSQQNADQSNLRRFARFH